MTTDHDTQSDEGALSEHWTALDDICAFADDKLDPKMLGFALVVWVPGKADRQASIAICGPPESQGETRAALATAVTALNAGGPK